MSSISTDIYNPFQHPWWSLNFFLILWASSFFIRQLHLGYTCKQLIPHAVQAKFEALSEDKKRNVITYVLEITVTTFAVTWQVYGGKDILLRLEDTTTLHHLNWMTMALQAIAILYVWEMVYREKMGWPLLLHHLCTITLIQLSSASFADTGNIEYIRAALILGFHATTEQTSFVALHMFRLDVAPKWQGFMFYLSAIQSLVLKTLFTVLSFIHWIYIVKEDKLTGRWG